MSVYHIALIEHYDGTRWSPFDQLQTADNYADDYADEDRANQCTGTRQRRCSVLRQSLCRVPVMVSVRWQYEITTQQHRLRLPYCVTVAADIV